MNRETMGGGDLGRHWQMASQSWGNVGEPLRPTDQDRGFLAGLIDERLAAGAPMERALLLGVTPEILGLAWPAATEVVSVDISADMIERVWRQAARPERSRALVGDWRHLPLPDRSIDLCLGDGCFVLVAAGDWPAVFAQLERVLTPGACFAIRVFSRSEGPESPEELVAAIRSGAITSIHMLKWRMGGSLQSDLKAGVACRRIWDLYQEFLQAGEIPAEQKGWSTAELATMERYSANDCTLHFPTDSEWAAALAPWFHTRAVLTGTYPHAERCRTYVLEPLPRTS